MYIMIMLYCRDDLTDSNENDDRDNNEVDAKQRLL